MWSNRQWLPISIKSHQLKLKFVLFYSRYRYADRSSQNFRLVEIKKKMIWLCVPSWFYQREPATSSHDHGPRGGFIWGGVKWRSPHLGFFFNDYSQVFIALHISLINMSTRLLPLSAASDPPFHGSAITSSYRPRPRDRRPHTILRTTDLRHELQYENRHSGSVQGSLW